MDGYAGEWDIGWPLDNRRALRRIEGGPMARTKQQLAGRVILDGAARMGADGVECDELAIGKVHQHSRVTIGGQGERNSAIRGYLAGGGDRTASSGGSRYITRACGSGWGCCGSAPLGR